MENPARDPKWQIVTGSVQGATHINFNLPNQDAIGYYQEVQESLPVIVSIADGLGDKIFFRSERGSANAVKASIFFGLQFLQEYSSVGELDEEFIRDHFCKPMVEAWLRQVCDDNSREPFTEQEKETNSRTARYFFENFWEDEIGREEKYISAFPYSTTSITLIATHDYFICVRIGNGDIVMIDWDGSVSCPFDGGKGEEGVFTLAIPGGRRFFKIWYKRYTPDCVPCAVILSTDGFGDSYENYDDFIRYLTLNVHEFFSTYEVQEIQEGINSFLSRLSEAGSGDDITLGILCDTDRIKKIELMIPETSAGLDENPDGTSLEPDIPLESQEEGGGTGSDYSGESRTPSEEEKVVVNNQEEIPPGEEVQSPPVEEQNRNTAGDSVNFVGEGESTGTPGK